MAGIIFILVSTGIYISKSKAGMPYKTTTHEFSGELSYRERV